MGHTKAAAGIGGFIKAVMAVNQRVIPPTSGCRTPNPVFNTSVQCAYPVVSKEVRQPTDILCAGISAMGFGGINSHATITSGDDPAVHIKPPIEERALLVSNQDTELFVLSALSIEDMIDAVQALMSLAEGISVAEMVDLAAKVSEEVELFQAVRAAIIAGTPDELKLRLEKLKQMLNDLPPAAGEIRVSAQQDIWLANSVPRWFLAGLFHSKW